MEDALLEEALSEFIAVIMLLALYFIPAMIAFYRGHSDRIAILFVNTIFGLTILGWVAALIWALSSKSKVVSESGINVIINDQKTFSNTIGDDGRGRDKYMKSLENLKGLLDGGAITQQEFDKLKSDIISNATK